MRERGLKPNVYKGDEFGMSLPMRERGLKA